MNAQDAHQRHHGQHSHANPMKPVEGQVKVKRTRTGCLTCRSRKVKCDETPGQCKNCERVRAECRWPEVRGVLGRPSPRATSHTTRRTRQTSCRACRIAKSRCSRDRPSCFRCRDQKLACDYRTDESETALTVITEATPTPTEHSTSDLTPPHGPNNHPVKEILNVSSSEIAETISDSRSSDIIPPDVVKQHIQAFFDYIYPSQANAFIHRSTLLRDLQSGRVSRVLLLTLCAVASRFVPFEKSDNRPAPLIQDSPTVRNWIHEARAMIFTEQMTIDTVKAALLLARHDIHLGRYEPAWMLSSIASRAALAIGLHREGDVTLPWIELETRRRLLWACYCLDRMMSRGVPEFGLIRTECINIQLPCEDHYYRLNIPCSTPVPYLELEAPEKDPNSPEKLLEERDIGLFGRYVQLTGMRNMILQCTRNQTGNIHQTPPWEPLSAFAHCFRKITAWYHSLSPQFQLIPDTILARHEQKQSSALLMLHIMYHQCMLDLHRVALPGFSESLPSSILFNAPIGWVEENQTACVEHAQSVSKVFDIVTSNIERNELLLLDTSLPIYVYEAMRVQVQWLFMLPTDSRVEAMAVLKIQFTKLMGYVESMIKYFQQAQFLLKEMRNMLHRHGIFIHGQSERIQHNVSSAPSPHHPWSQRLHTLKEDSRSDESVHTPSTLQMGLLNEEDLYKTPSLSVEGNLFPSPNTEPAFGEADLFDPYNPVLSTRYNQGQVIMESSSLIGPFSDWMANGFEVGQGLHGTGQDDQQM